MTGDLAWLWGLTQVVLLLGFNVWFLRRSVRARRNDRSLGKGFLFGLSTLVLARWIVRLTSRDR